MDGAAMDKLLTPRTKIRLIFMIWINFSLFILRLLVNKKNIIRISIKNILFIVYRIHDKRLFETDERDKI